MDNIIILAAGKGKRMKSSLSKVLHKIGGISMFEISLKLAQQIKGNIITVASPDNYSEISGFPGHQVVMQNERLGTGHAVLQALPFLSPGGKTLILYGDTPLLTLETIFQMEKSSFNITVLGFEGETYEEYGRLIINGKFLEKIIEWKDANLQEKQIKLFNSGIFFIETDILKELVPLISNHNANKEYYLTDIIELASKRGYKSKVILCPKQETLGVNTQQELSICARLIQENLRKKHMQNGVTLHDPQTAYFEMENEIEQDVIIEPNVILKGKVIIKKGAVIKAFSYLENCIIEEKASIGPFARIRGCTFIGPNVHIGNFVEIKNSHLEQDVKAGHLAYIGDASIGKRVNIGAGAIFCNFDGSLKHKTQVGDDSFIGSNANLIAPLQVAEKTVIAAGSTITRNNKAESLIIERGREREIKGYFSKKFKK